MLLTKQERKKYADFIEETYTAFINQNGPLWEGNIYNDDIMWACIAFARMANLTGNKQYAKYAKTAANWSHKSDVWTLVLPKFDIEGILQWGYNFYNNMHSVNTINPYADVSGEYWVPAGDPFSVYPAEDGTAYESTRIIVFHEALEDCRAMKLAESFYGKERVIAEIEAVFGKEIKFSRCAKSADMMLAVRAKVDELIAEAVAKEQ